jgi:paraquat-inducible protein A
MNALCCSSCGLMMQDEPSAKEIYCPRCEHCVRKEACSIAFALSLAIAALIMFVPAITLPILTFELGNTKQTSTMLTALYYFFQDGYPELSVILFLSTIMAPFVQILVSLFFYLSLSRKIKPKHMKFCYRILFYIRDWVMLDIYLIAILVAFIKLSATSEIIYGTGLVFFVFLMLFSFLLNRCLSPKKIWKAYHDAQ